jgi:hypothetical protein
VTLLLGFPFDLAAGTVAFEVNDASGPTSYGPANGEPIPAGPLEVTITDG